MVCWFIHELNQIKSCQQAIEVSGELIRWATNVNIEISTDQDLVIFWENDSQKLGQLMNKALIIFRRAIDKWQNKSNCKTLQEKNAAITKTTGVYATQTSKHMQGQATRGAS